MRTAIDFHCDQHSDPFECPDFLIAYNSIVDEYGIPIRDGGGSVLTIRNCPFCGSTLPDSKLDRWFDELAALGFTGPFDETIPEAYRSHVWWRAPEKQEDR